MYVLHGEPLSNRHFIQEKMDDVLEFYGLNYYNPNATNMIDYLREKLIESPSNYLKEYVFYQGRFKTCRI